MRYFQSIFAASTLFLTAQTGASAADRPFAPPLIQTSQDPIAVAVAHALEVADNRTHHVAPVTDEAYWQKRFRATYANGVWKVQSINRYSQNIGAIAVQIAAQRGRALSLIYCRSARCPREQVAAATAPVGHWAGQR